MLIDKLISYHIDKQFPSLFREEGQEFVQFMKSYYEFLETDIEGWYVSGYKMNGLEGLYSSNENFSVKYSSKQEALTVYNSLLSNLDIKDLSLTYVKNQSIFHNKRLFEYNDIDNTISELVLFFKNKFLNDFPFEGDSTRFVIKHILDFYRRKGSKEGLELFFKLFYNSTVNVYYPSIDIIKPSSSIWKVGKYLELYPVEDITFLKALDKTIINGSISGAYATVDKINFAIIDNTIIPILFLSGIKGEFVKNDDILNSGTFYGKVKGSLRSITFIESETTLFSNNSIGDVVELYSSTGNGSQGKIKNISTSEFGGLSFNINDGGFGYTTTNTDIIISNQILFIDNPDLDYTLLENVKQANTGAMGFVVGQTTTSLGLKVYSSNGFNIGLLSTVDRDVNANNTILFTTGLKTTNLASAKVGSISEVEAISVITDNLSDFLLVPLNANNYSLSPALTMMSGNYPSGLPAINANTVLSSAFLVKTLNIGKINTLSNIDPGDQYDSDVFALARENSIYKFEKRNKLIEYDPLTGTVNKNDIISQNSGVANTRIKGIVIDKLGSILTVSPLSFAEFSYTTNNNIIIDSSNTIITIRSVQTDYSSKPMGLNAIIKANAEYNKGKITEIEILDSGLGYFENDLIYIKNISKSNNMIAGVGTTVLGGVGITEGKWETKTSILNNKIIQDSNYYQDYSYEISTSLSPKIYAETQKNLAHTAGTKIFYKYELIDTIIVDANVQLEYNFLSNTDVSNSIIFEWNIQSGDGFIEFIGTPANSYGNATFIVTPLDGGIEFNDI